MVVNFDFTLLDTLGRTLCITSLYIFLSQIQHLKAFPYLVNTPLSALQYTKEMLNQF